MSVRASLVSTPYIRSADHPHRERRTGARREQRDASDSKLQVTMFIIVVVLSSSWKEKVGKLVCSLIASIPASSIVRAPSITEAGEGRVQQLHGGGSPVGERGGHKEPGKKSRQHPTSSKVAAAGYRRVLLSDVRWKPNGNGFRQSCG